MFEDGARLDDIINVLRRPTLDKNDGDKQDARISDDAVRYESNMPLRDSGIKFDFAGQRNAEVLR